MFYKSWVNSSFYLSLALHFSLGLVFLFADSFSFIWSSKEEIKEKLVQSSIRVDIVGMPVERLQNLRKIDLSQKKTTKKPNLHKKSDFESFLKGQGNKKLNIKKNIPLVQNKRGRKANSKSFDKKAFDKIILMGNKISKGNSISGEYLSKQDGLLREYAEAVDDKVREHWILPSYLMNKGLSCRIQLFITSSGSLAKLEMVHSSGNNEYDMLAKSAINKSSPFNQPDKAIIEKLQRYGFDLSFPR